MRSNIGILWILTVFFFIVGSIYGFWTAADSEIEWAGTIAIILSGGLSGLIAFYLTLVYRNQGGALPEDADDANIDDGDAEQGFYSPWSWWPILFAGAAAITFTGLAVGIWLMFIGVPLLLVTLVGWVFEYNRGYFGR